MHSKAYTQIEESMSFAKQTFAKQTFAKQITLVKQWAGLIVCVNTPQKTSGDSAINLKKSLYTCRVEALPLFGNFLVENRRY